MPTLEALPPNLPISKPYWRAWGALSPCRQSINGVRQPLQVSEILAYCELTGIDDYDAREDLLEVLQHLDEVYLSYKPR